MEGDPSLISRTVSVDVKHHAFFLSFVEEGGGGESLLKGRDGRINFLY